MIRWRECRPSSPINRKLTTSKTTTRSPIPTTRHILLRLGELIAYAECAGSLARRAALMAKGKLTEKASRRFDALALAAMSRVFAREAALKVAQEGLRLIVGAGGVSDADLAAFETSLGLPAIHRAQAGLISDMDSIADALYNRTAKQLQKVA